MRAKWLILALIGSFAFAHDAAKAVRYYTVPIDGLEIVEGSLPPENLATYLPQLHHGGWPWYEKRATFGVTLDQAGESELVVENNLEQAPWAHTFLAIATSAEPPIQGTVKWSLRSNYKNKSEEDKEGTFRFRLPPSANTTHAREWFAYGRAARLLHHYSRQLSREAPGQAWFRRQIHNVELLRPDNDLAYLWNGPQPRQGKQVEEPRFEASTMEPNWRRVDAIRTTDLGRDLGRFNDNWNSDITELLSGGRAISENLQLKRNLNVRGDQKDFTVRVADLPNITVKEFDWTPLTKDLHPQLDPLASLIPSNQHAMFFPSVPAALAVLDEIDRTGLAVFHLTAMESSDSRLTERYLRQLGIPAAKMAAMMPPGMVNGVAVTGGDLYFDTGTDVAVLLATEKPELIRQLLMATWPALRAAYPDAAEFSPVIAGISCKVLQTPDRRLSVYAADLAGALVLANSPAQIKQLAAVSSGKLQPLAALQEYVFFRDRYRRGEGDETGFAILPDAAIRRWCSAQWRIGHHRRLLNAAVLADVYASQLPAMISAKDDRTIDWPGLGPVQVTSHGVLAANLGAREFQTPIGETEIELCTKAEADGYRNWRDSYQRNWNQFFDPIAVRVTAKPERLAIDMTVMPLIERTRYREMFELSQGAKLPATAGDPHPETMGQFIMGFNRESRAYKELMQQAQGLLSPKLAIDSWLGDWFTLYVDEDPLWAEFAKHEGEPEEFWRKHQYSIPVAAAAHVRDSLKLALFLTALKALIDTAAPNLVSWETVEYRETGYLKIQGKSEDTANAALYSLPLQDVWVVSPNEAVIKRAIDRYLARKSGTALSGPGWLGDSAAFHARPQGVEFLAHCWRRWGVESYQQAAWANLPILNEWKRLAPDADPVAFHEKWWGERLLCPGGGTFVWNAEDGTMESSILGHPGRPKTAPALLPAALRNVRDARAGVTFEMNGLRARVELTRDAK